MTADNYCFCELAPLYALDLLSEPERHWVERQVFVCPELEEELSGYQLATTALPYSIPSGSVASDLKNRLFDRLGLALPSPRASEIAQSAASSIVRAQDLQWQPHPVSGVLIAIVHRDEQKREISGVLQAEPGVQYPFHRHATVEEIYMLAGDLIIGGETYGAGDYIRSPAGSGHAPYTYGGCQFFFRTSMDDEYPSVAMTGAS
ncbi:MAG: cupin domain-containing protein [Scytolyngbya sp. HA4215-MV1]|jgi:anti-sigma factor ChrR (cupin superfamily)|nr:cupin domain-containing protein [Scytolyngbya sp. HA4215-MV1]